PSPTTLLSCVCFVLSAPATTVPHPLSLHDALPIFSAGVNCVKRVIRVALASGPMPPRMPRKGPSNASSISRTYLVGQNLGQEQPDRKSTRLNSSHVKISYAVFCLKKKKKKNRD